MPGVTLGPGTWPLPVALLSRTCAFPACGTPAGTPGSLNRASHDCRRGTRDSPRTPGGPPTVRRRVEVDVEQSQCQGSSDANRFEVGGRQYAAGMRQPDQSRAVAAEMPENSHVTHCICWGTRPVTILQPGHDRALTIPALNCVSLPSGCEKGQQTGIATRRCEVRDA
jgi:hypothetical protein